MMNIVERKKKTTSKRKVKDMLFYLSIIVVPFAIVVFFYLSINLGSMLMAFQKYDYDLGKYVFSGMENFVAVCSDFYKSKMLQDALLRSIVAYLITIVVTTTIPVFFSFYIFKKFKFSKFFKIVLFLPQVISPIITATIFKFLTDRVLPTFMLNFGIEMEGLLSNTDTTFATILTYYLWMSLGGGLLVQLGAMNSVNDATIESAKMDGVNLWQEFWYIVLPQTYQILLIGFILGFSFIFTADLGIYSFYGLTADSKVYTIGYYFTKKTFEATSTGRNYYAAFGLIISAIVIPVTFLLRKIVYTYGPSED